jgi:hypothetical protein
MVSFIVQTLLGWQRELNVRAAAKNHRCLHFAPSQCAAMGVQKTAMQADKG